MKLFLSYIIISAQLTVMQAQTGIYPPRENKFNDTIKHTTGIRIHEHLKQFSALQAQGLSSGEIHKIIEPEINAKGTGSISGYCYREDGSPLGYMCEMGAFNEYGYFMGYSNISYEDNSFNFQSLPPGNYYIRTLTYGNFTDEFYDNALTWQDAKLIQVDTSLVPDINFYLSSHSGCVTGRVTNSENQAVSNSTVRITVHDELSYSTQSNEDGYFFLQNVAPGQHWISANHPDYALIWYKNSASSQSAEKIEVSEFDTLKNINFVLTPGAAITGKVTAAGNNSAFSYRVQVYDENNSWISVNVFFKESYTITGLAEGKYKLQFQYSGNENFISGYYTDAFSLTAALITVHSGDTTKNINYTFPKGGSITGNIINGTENLRMGLSIYKENNPFYFLLNNPRFTYDKNKFTISRLPSGRYKVYFYFNNLIDQWYNNKDNYNAADWITVNAPDSTKNISIILNSGSSIYGTIYSPDENLLKEHCYIDLYDTSYNYLESAYSSDGSYIFEGIRPGKYKLNIVCSGNDLYSSEWYNNKYNITSADFITLGDQCKLNIDFTLGYQSSIQGFLKNNDDEIIDGSDRQKIALLYDAATGDYITEAYISFTGGYNLLAPHGNFKLAFITLDPSDSLTVTYYGGGKCFDDPSSEIINLNNTPFKVNDIKLTKAENMVSGMILNSEDSSSVGSLEYSLHIYDEQGYIVKRLLNQHDPHYKITGIRPGNYYIALVYFTGVSYYALWYQHADPYLPLAFLPKTTIPIGANPVKIEHETNGINFYISSPSTADPVANTINGFTLEQNYPNPFNPETNISYTIPEAAAVTLKLYNMLGEELETLIDEEQNAGKHNINWNASCYSSGIYFYTLQAGKNRETKKLLLLK